MNLKNAIGMLTGAGLGWAYYKFIGCTTGACPLTSNPWISAFIGLMFGAVLTSNANRPKQAKARTEITDRG